MYCQRLVESMDTKGNNNKTSGELAEGMSAGGKGCFPSADVANRVEYYLSSFRLKPILRIGSVLGFNSSLK